MDICERKKKIESYRQQIALLEAEIEKLNPYGNLKNLSNKAFGEGWSEPYILEHCPSFTRVDAKGYDFTCQNLARLKSNLLGCLVNKLRSTSVIYMKLIGFFL